MKTTFLGVRKLTKLEKEDQKADLIFMRENARKV